MTLAAAADTYKVILNLFLQIVFSTTHSFHTEISQMQLSEKSILVVCNMKYLCAESSSMPHAPVPLSAAETCPMPLTLTINDMIRFDLPAK
jgi:hypothetical protein